MQYATLQRELDAIAEDAHSVHDVMEGMVALLRREVPHYDWVGFYLLSEDGKTLELGPYSGAPTPHTRIPLGQGICGAAVSSGETIVVDDVSADPRYLACSMETKSEIVVPIYRYGQVIGELDIDSHAPAAFTRQDRELVESCVRRSTRVLEAQAA